MPDQSSAADEHALIQEITAPLTTLPDDALPVVADTDFAIVLRGYDRVAVDDYVRRTSQLVAELQATRSPEAATRRALERVGEQISGILKRAHETAAEITAQSRRDAEDRLEIARREAAGIVSSAEARLRELDGDTDRIWVERQRIVDDVRSLSEELLSLADSAGERFPPADETAAEAGERPEIREPDEPEPIVEPQDEPPVEDPEPAIGDSDTDPTAVLPKLEGLDVDPPSFPGRDSE
jgi:cell division septum initiation protein DivIVA